MSAHPHDHVGDAGDGHQGEDRLESLLLRGRDGPALQDDAIADAEPSARATPNHTGRRACRWPRWIKKAAMMPTINDASSPPGAR